MRLRTKLALAVVILGAVCYGNPAVAQPLVTGNLTLYYDFDEIVTNEDGVKQFLDESGNNFPATIYEGDPDIDLEPGTVTVDTATPLRGDGAVRFTQSSLGEDAPAYLDLDGQNITENFPELLPTGGLNDIYGVTFAAWLNVSANDVSDQSVFQGRTSDAGHGAPHFQLQGNGKFRMTFRNQTSGNVVNAPQVFIDGTEDSGEAYPVNEWFHYAGTYDVDENAWAMYYNGTLIQSGDGSGEDLGDWGGVEGELFGAGVGAVYDNGGRRLDGLMDELYVFNRALTAEEIATLATPPVAVPTCENIAATRIPGDADGDGEVAFLDFLALANSFGADAGYEGGDFDCNGEVAFLDFLTLAENFGATAAVTASSVPEPSSLALLGIWGVLLGLGRRSRV